MSMSSAIKIRLCIRSMQMHFSSVILSRYECEWKLRSVQVQSYLQPHKNSQHCQILWFAVVAQYGFGFEKNAWTGELNLPKIIATGNAVFSHIIFFLDFSKSLSFQADHFSSKQSRTLRRKNNTRLLPEFSKMASTKW